ncbi:hypothetical protein CEXT_670701 [Caerostris extrusa]|uniref:Maturase K n=1 Tax=Caerostris extrusa TaxID=172846 RepID=A0AAV4QRP8_CAEEX|nr:hypothetical protein CEXT_670701 [Caerostris extrusa]
MGYFDYEATINHLSLGDRRENSIRMNECSIAIPKKLPKFLKLVRRSILRDFPSRIYFPLTFKSLFSYPALEVLSPALLINLSERDYAFLFVITFRKCLWTIVLLSKFEQLQETANRKTMQ